MARSMCAWMGAVFDSFEVATAATAEVIVAPLALSAVRPSASSDAHVKMNLGFRQRPRNHPDVTNACSTSGGWLGLVGERSRSGRSGPARPRVLHSQPADVILSRLVRII